MPDSTTLLKKDIEKLSIVVPTKNRGHFLRKLLEYHSRMHNPCVIRIGDASDPEGLEENRKMVEKLCKGLEVVHEAHPPEASLIGGTNLLLEKVTTPYSVLSGDDDFLVPRCLAECVAFLEEHPDYSCACGQQAYVTVTRGPDNRFQVENAVAGYTKGHEEDLPSQRMVQYCLPFRANNTFSVQRTKNMRFAWKKASQIGLDKTKYHSHPHEVGVNVMSLIQGKQKKFQELYHVMLRHREREGGERSSFQGDRRWFARMCRWNWSEEIPALVAWWAEELSKAEGLPFGKAEEIAEAVFMQCWIPVMEVWRDDLLARNWRTPVYPRNSKEYLFEWLKQKSWARKAWEKIRAGQKLSLPDFLNERSPYYKDFEPIQKVLSESL